MVRMKLGGIAGKIVALSVLPALIVSILAVGATTISFELLKTSLATLNAHASESAMIAQAARRTQTQFG